MIDAFPPVYRLESPLLKSAGLFSDSINVSERGRHATNDFAGICSLIGYISQCSKRLLRVFITRRVSSL